MTTCLRLFPFAAAAFAAPAAAQSFLDLVESRTVASPYPSIFEVEAGAIGCAASENGDEYGLRDDISWDGHVYFRDEAFSSRRGTLEAYGGRDGIYAGFYDGKIVGDQTVTRFEVRARPWQFYRDASYDGSRLVDARYYEGRDYEGYIGFGRAAGQGLYFELGPYYQRNEFERGLTVSPVEWALPEDHASYGGRLYVEHNTVQMDRRRGMPREGFVLTVLGEREWNDMDADFGRDGFLVTLPSAVWRAKGRLEWYVPAADEMTWEVFARGGWNDELDRIENFDSTHPLGHQWVDAQLRLRMHLGNSMTLSPFVQGQYTRVDMSTQGGEESQKEFFVGGGVETYIHFHETFSLHAFYSYLDTESRPSIRVDEDVHGEHMAYVGLVIRFGGGRR